MLSSTEGEAGQEAPNAGAGHYLQTEHNQAGVRGLVAHHGPAGQAAGGHIQARHGNDDHAGRGHYEAHLEVSNVWDVKHTRSSLGLGIMKHTTSRVWSGTL